MRQLKRILMLLAITAMAFAAAARPFAEKPEMGDGGTPIIINPIPLPAPNSPRTAVPISAMVNGNTVYVTFTGDLGDVDYELVNLSTAETVSDQVEGTGLVLIPFSGDAGTYTLTFTLESGMQYYGEFSL